MWIDQQLRRMMLLAASVVLPGVACAGTQSSIQELIGARRCATYQPATTAHLQQAEAAFVALLENPQGIPDDAADAWAQLGFSLSTYAAGGATWLILRETPGRCRGQGLYLIRLGKAAGLLLQVPHGYSDRHTDDIAAGLLQTPLRAMAFNTVPRHTTSQGMQSEADLAHRADNLFAALTRAFARVYPVGRLVQLHGFDPAKRNTAAGRSAAAIVSAGTAWPTPASVAVATCMQGLLHEPVRLYPRDVRELGATTNVQGRLLREFAHNGFVHVELSRALRERLRNDDSLRSAFVACLYEGMEQQ